MKGPSYSEQLGLGAVVGDEIWDQQSRVRIRLGPLTIAQYHDFLPGGGEPTGASVRSLDFSLEMSTIWKLQLILEAKEVPACMS